MPLMEVVETKYMKQKVWRSLRMPVRHLYTLETTFPQRFRWFLRFMGVKSEERTSFRDK